MLKTMMRDGAGVFQIPVYKMPMMLYTVLHNWIALLHIARTEIIGLLLYANWATLPD